jgi:heptosyltransferase II
MQRILIIQTAFIGDVVLATALIEKLHESYPSASIDFLLRKGNEGLLKDHPYLNEVLIWNKKENKFKHLLQLLSTVRKRKYDAVINVQRFAATGFLTAFSNAKFKVGFNKNPFSFLFTKSVKHVISTAEAPLHEIDRNQQLIEAFTNSIPTKPRLYPSDQDFDSVKELTSTPYIVIGPASVWFTKQYPKEKWIRFIDRVDPKLNVFLIGAPGDFESAEEIKTKSIHKKVINLCGKYNFLQSAALQRDALMNYVNDSAPMHFASAMNAPVTAIYCSTLPSFGFGPLSDKSFIVEIEEALPCRPCGLHGLAACPLGHFNCAMKIREEQLLKTLE